MKLHKNRNIAIINSVTDKSTGKICYGLFNFFIVNKMSCFFCYGYGKRLAENHTYRIDSIIERYIHVILARLFGLQGSFSIFATLRLINYLKRNNINTIYAASLHGYYLNERLFFRYIKENNIDFIYIMIDEYPFRGKCCYSHECIKYLSYCGRCPYKKEYPKSLFFDHSRRIATAKSKWYSSIKEHSLFIGPEYTIIEAKKSPLMKNVKTVVIDESIDTDLYSPKDVSALKKELHISNDAIVILCVAPSSYERKGTKYFLELAKRFENTERYVFIHVGYTDSKDCLPNNYIPIGYISDQKMLACYYSLGDLFVFPSLLDTMPNACLEALACGVPLLCFDISGMPYIGDKTVMSLVEAKNVDEMETVVRNTNKITSNKRNHCREYALNRYSNKEYYKKLENILNDF